MPFTIICPSKKEKKKKRASETSQLGFSDLYFMAWKSLQQVACGDLGVTKG